MPRGKAKTPKFVCVFHKIIKQKFSKVEAQFFLSNPMYSDKICKSCREVLSKIILGRLMDATQKETGRDHGFGESEAKG